MMRVVRVFLPVLFLLSLSACAESDVPVADERPRSSASIAIGEPDAGELVTGKTFEVGIKLDGGKIVDQVSRDLTPTEGHVHVLIDGKIQSQTFGLNDKLAVPKKRGTHLLTAEFVAKDHGPFNPRVLASVPFEVG